MSNLIFGPFIIQTLTHSSTSRTLSNTLVLTVSIHVDVNIKFIFVIISLCIWVDSKLKLNLISKVSEFHLHMP